MPSPPDPSDVAASSQSAPEETRQSDGAPGGSAGFLSWFSRGDASSASQTSLLERYGGVVLLLAMIVLFSVTLRGEFLTYDNLIGVLNNTTIAGIMSLALLLPLAAGVFDISIGGAMTLAVVVVTWLFQTTTGSMPIPLAIAITLGVGVIIGCVNGGLVVKARVDPFIATIGTASILLGVSEAVANGTTISEDIPSRFTDLGRTYVYRTPITLGYLLVVAAILWYVTEYTPFGRRIYATGAGREAARLSGVRTDRLIFISFIVSAVLASLAGVVYGARIGAGPPNVGANYLLPAFSAAFFGSTMIRPGRFNVLGLLLALLIVYIGINGLQLYGIAFWIVDVYQGLVLVLAVVFARLRSPRS
jgi:ribose transport system permease protein